MIAFIAVFAAKLLDPVAAAVAIVVGLFKRNWWWAIGAGLIAASFQEFLLFQMQAARVFHIGQFLIGWVAYFIWAIITIWIRRRMASDN